MGDHETKDSDPPAAPAAAAVPDRAHAEHVAQLFRDHNSMLIRFLVTRLQSVAEAHEVAQEAYVRVLQLDKPGASNLLRAYLFRVAQNLAIDRMRRRATRRQVSLDETTMEDLAEDLSEPSRHAIAHEELTTIARCLRELPDRCVKAFLMYRMDGETQAGIARQLGVSERMINMYIRQAMLYCRLRLDGVPAGEARARLPR